MTKWVMLQTILQRSIRLLLLTALLPALASAQQATLTPTLTQIVKSGEGVARLCYQKEYGTGLGARLSVPVLSRWTTLQVGGRGHWLNRGSTCDTGGFPPPDGTYVEVDRVNLLSRSFITTDVRLSTRLGEARAVNLAAGVGNAWHEGHDLPYLVLAAGGTILEGPKLRIRLESEYQLLRVTSDRFQRTYLDFELVAEESLGRVREWSDALVFGLSGEIPLSGTLQ